MYRASGNNGCPNHILSMSEQNISPKPAVEKYPVAKLRCHELSSAYPFGTVLHPVSVPSIPEKCTSNSS